MLAWRGFCWIFTRENRPRGLLAHRVKFRVLLESRIGCGLCEKGVGALHQIRSGACGRAALD